jgi:hypothetical protein
MPGLRELELSQRQRGASTLRLPSVKLLRLKVVDPGFLAAVDAPQLQVSYPLSSIALLGYRDGAQCPLLSFTVWWAGGPQS